MPSTSHDDVANGGGSGELRPDGPVSRRFEDRAGQPWEVVWQPAVSGRDTGEAGTYRFRALDGGATYVLAGSTQSGARLAHMTLADVRQLLELARAEASSD